MAGAMALLAVLHLLLYCTAAVDATGMKFSSLLASVQRWTGGWSQKKMTFLVCVVMTDLGKCFGTVSCRSLGCERAA